jgi:hypothetical protein
MKLHGKMVRILDPVPHTMSIALRTTRPIGLDTPNKTETNSSYGEGLGLLAERSWDYLQTAIPIRKPFHLSKCPVMQLANACKWDIDTCSDIDDRIGKQNLELQPVL